MSTRTRSDYLSALSIRTYAPDVQRLYRRKARQTGRETRCAVVADAIVTAERERERGEEEKRVKEREKVIPTAFHERVQDCCACKCAYNILHNNTKYTRLHHIKRI